MPLFVLTLKALFYNLSQPTARVSVAAAAASSAASSAVTSASMAGGWLAKRISGT